MTSTTTLRRVQRVRHELRRREVEVRRVETRGANFVAVTFGGDALRDFVSLSFDDHVKFMFETADGETVRRDYTPRRFDPVAEELTIEFALHGPGLASDWARAAVAGRRAVIGGPRGSMIVPADFDWHLLAGDATALPAIDRRLEELPAGTRAVVIVQLDDANDRRHFASAADVRTHWVSDPDSLLSTVAGLDLSTGEGFAWAAGEARVMAHLRRLLVERHAMAREAMRIAAYWKRGTMAFESVRDEALAGSPA